MELFLTIFKQGFVVITRSWIFAAMLLVLIMIFSSFSASLMRFNFNLRDIMLIKLIILYAV